MESNDVHVRISLLEEKSNRQAIQIVKLEDKTNTLNRIEMICEQQLEFNKESQKQSKELTSTLIEMSNNLKNLNKSYEKLDTRVETLERSDSTRKIDPSQFTKDIFYKILPSVATTIIGAYLLYHFGINK
ncbi:hypothetical protein CEY02_19865 [Bacillus pumilus]|uniref:Uncharacterized protein n=1 Tax=Bacillus pumilus TaxID=1408 RepID=A0A2A5IKS1_BACPU|nr:hypothetical protein [Bacillus pumilus]MBU8573797.1 hypothetical protein [Bacillus pumilus]PCK17692.1 hypothetical protein CEY02_19865 [Bacillus pumilus]